MHSSGQAPSDVLPCAVMRGLGPLRFICRSPQHSSVYTAVTDDKGESERQLSAEPPCQRRLGVEQLEGLALRNLQGAAEPLVKKSLFSLS